MNFEHYYDKHDCLRVIVKPNAAKTSLIGFDSSYNAFRISLNAIPDKGKANDALLKFLYKETKKRFKIIRGVTAREKVLKMC